MKKVLRDHLGFVVLGLAFWIPSVIVHAIRTDRFGMNKFDLVLVNVLPLLISGYAFFMNLKRLPSVSRPLASLLFLYGIWACGPFMTMLGASFSRGGFTNDGTWSFVAKATFLYPYTTFIAATYDGTLGALILLTLLLLIACIIYTLRTIRKGLHNQAL